MSTDERVNVKKVLAVCDVDDSRTMDAAAIDIVTAEEETTINSQLLEACDEGNVQLVEDLFKTNDSLNVNATLNDDGDAALHRATKGGYLSVIEFLLTTKKEINLNAKNKSGHTALYIATVSRRPDIVELLCHFGADCNIPDELTKLLCTSKEQEFGCLFVRLKHSRTPLHIAIQTLQVQTASILLQFGCQVDSVDDSGEAPINIATRENLLPIVQLLCARECDANKKTAEGLTALHTAAKEGQIEVVRCLLLGGADLDILTQNGVKAEDLARAHGHPDVGDLLANLSASIMRDRRPTVVRQLLPTNKFLSRIRVNILGCSGVGKTTLIESLKCGFIRSLFRRSGASALASAGLSPTVFGNNYQAPVHLQYTPGIDIQQANISVAGDLSIWEFSGYEPYYCIHDMFVGDHNAIYVVVVSMNSSASERLKQLDFWLNFIRVRSMPAEPLGFGGSKLYGPRVLIIATHADVVQMVDNKSGATFGIELIKHLMEKYSSDLFIEPHLFLMDAHQAMGTEMKLLRQVVSDLKQVVTQSLPPSTGMLESALLILPEWRRILAAFPVVTWPGFMQYVRARVNLLATEDLLHELAYQLQLMGEVYCLANEGQELVVVNPRWLCTDIVGKLLAYDTIIHGPVDGRFSVDDVRLLFPKHEPNDILVTLDALDLGYTRTQLNGGDTVCHLFKFNRTIAPTLQQLLPNDQEIFGGFRVEVEYPDQLVHVFQRLVFTLIRRIENYQRVMPSGETELTAAVVEQWSTTVKITRQQSLTAVVQLSANGNQLNIVCCGPSNLTKSVFFLQEDVCEVIYSCLESCCPAMYLERSPLSVSSLKLAIKNDPTLDKVHVYRPREIVLSQLAGSTSLPNLSGTDKEQEKIIDLVAFGNKEVFSCLQPGINQPVSMLPLYARYRLAKLLDSAPDGSQSKIPPSASWTALEAALGIPPDPTIRDEKHKDAVPINSPTDWLIAEWARLTGPEATMRALHDKLSGLNRPDVVDAFISLTPLYRYVVNSPN